MECIFCRIAAKEVPATFLLEDERVFAIRDVQPLAPSHVLVIPRMHVPSLFELEDRELGGRLLEAAGVVARLEGLERGWRLIANTREHGGQEVNHLHLHVLGGRSLGRMLASK
jgi:histidine triad (HIT) family protein